MDVHVILVQKHSILQEVDSCFLKLCPDLQIIESVKCITESRDLLA